MIQEDFSLIKVDVSDESKEAFWVKSQKTTCYNECMEDTRDRRGEPTCDQKCGL